MATRSHRRKKHRSQRPRATGAATKARGKAIEAGPRHRASTIITIVLTALGVVLTALGVWIARLQLARTPGSPPALASPILVLPSFNAVVPPTPTATGTVSTAPSPTPAERPAAASVPSRRSVPSPDTSPDVPRPPVPERTHAPVPSPTPTSPEVRATAARDPLAIDSLVTNASFEDPERHDRGWGFMTNTDHYVYCSGAGYRSACFMRFGLKAEQASVRQDVSYQALKGTRLAAKVMLRCPQARATCIATIAYWGLDAPRESRAVENVRVPGDGRWYECRLDVEHGAARGFTSEHDTLRIEIYNNGYGARLIDIDAVSFGPYSTAPPPHSGTAACLPAA